MTWTVWDILVVLAVVVQFALLGASAYFVLKIKNGPIALVLKQTTLLIDGGKNLAQTGKSVASQQMPHLRGLAAHFVGLRRVLHWHTPPGPFSYAKLLSAFGTLRTVRRGLSQVQSFRARKTTPPDPPKAARVAKPSFAQRLGLVPPAAKYLGKAYGVVRLLLRVRRELRVRNLLFRVRNLL